MGEEYGEDRPFAFFCSFGDPGLVQAVREGRKKEFLAFAWQGQVPDPQAEGTFLASRLSWSWPQGSSRAALRRLYADLLTARRQWPALANFTERATRLLPDPDKGPLLELVRGGRCPESGKTLPVYFNLSGQPQALPRGAAEGLELLFSSEARRYAGARQGGPVRELLPFECAAFGPGAWQPLI
jgi:maltooligosyltrehalose trehalohydrolase